MTLATPRDLAVELDRAGIIGPRHTTGLLHLIADYIDCDNQEQADDCIRHYGGTDIKPLNGMNRWRAGPPDEPIIIRWPVTS